ncbi:type II secretion system F family protein [Methanoregula sp.]|uniref:type II secretion system F family protein n=1 Tax=Methanoregula sp. TaxID=2052170 RepID=UPI002BA8BB81|nr:type II secretion system F family protein [Methanoregula sp.]HVP97016.1 type II secretion system F family protein [Methanoregula sp.]
MQTPQRNPPVRKKMDELHEIIERIRIKYNPPREIFTIAIPVAIALLVVLAAFLMGYTLHTTEKQQASATTSDKEQALQAYLAQMNAENGNATTAAATPSAPAAPTMGLDEVMVFALIIAILPYSIDITLQKRAVRKKEELYTEFLFKLSELMRGGLDPIKAVKELAKTDLGVLTPHIRIASTSMVYGKSFEEAMKAMAKSLHSDLITRYTLLVIQASYSGGSVADLILKASEDMRSIISIEREKEGNLHQYVMIFYFAQAIIIFIVYILTTSLLPFVQQLGATQMFGKTDIGNIDFARGFFHMIILNSIFGGLIIGKISEGDSRYGLKHVVVLVAVGYLASALFILPPPVEQVGPKVNITVISGGQQVGLASLPLANPIVFKLTDAAGNPVNSTSVQFSITPSGSVSPLTDTSNNDGLVQVKPVLGADPGTYFIVAKANGVTVSVPITVSNGGAGANPAASTGG